MDRGILLEMDRRFYSKRKPMLESASHLCFLLFSPSHLTKFLAVVVCYRPADISSWCVVDFADDRQHELVTGLLNRSAHHGLKNVQYQEKYLDMTRELTVTVRLDRSGDVKQQVWIVGVSVEIGILCALHSKFVWTSLGL